MRGHFHWDAEVDGAAVQVAVYSRGERVESVGGAGGSDFSPSQHPFAGEITVEVVDVGLTPLRGRTVDCHRVTAKTPFGGFSCLIPKKEFDFSSGYTCGYFASSELTDGRIPLLYYVETTHKTRIADAVRLAEIQALSQSGRFLLISLIPRITQPEVGQVSPEAAPSASPDEPST
jgi:hypothetical protein